MLTEKIIFTLKVTVATVAFSCYWCVYGQNKNLWVSDSGRAERGGSTRKFKCLKYLFEEKEMDLNSLITAQVQLDVLSGFLS